MGMFNDVGDREKEALHYSLQGEENTTKLLYSSFQHSCNEGIHVRGRSGTPSVLLLVNVSK